jgi:hypothetical protein
MAAAREITDDDYDLVDEDDEDAYHNENAENCSAHSRGPYVDGHHTIHRGGTRFSTGHINTEEEEEEEGEKDEASLPSDPESDDELDDNGDTTFFSAAAVEDAAAFTMAADEPPPLLHVRAARKRRNAVSTRAALYDCPVNVGSAINTTVQRVPDSAVSCSSNNNDRAAKRVRWMHPLTDDGATEGATDSVVVDEDEEVEGGEQLPPHNYRHPQDRHRYRSHQPREEEPLLRIRVRVRLACTKPIPL